MSIVYSTTISKQIRFEFERYQKIKSSKASKVEINAAYCKFASTCEKENKSALAIFEELIKEK